MQAFLPLIKGCYYKSDITSVADTLIVIVTTTSLTCIAIFYANRSASITLLYNEYVNILNEKLYQSVNFFTICKKLMDIFYKVQKCIVTVFPSRLLNLKVGRIMKRHLIHARIIDY
jgi:hypothetical protein